MSKLEKTIEVDPLLPGNHDEFPFPQAKQCSPELDSPSFQFKCSFGQKYTVPREKLVVPVVVREKRIFTVQWSSQGRDITWSNSSLFCSRQY